MHSWDTFGKSILEAKINIKVDIQKCRLFINYKQFSKQHR